MLSTLQTYCYISEDQIVCWKPHRPSIETDRGTYIVSDGLLDGKSFIVDIFSISDSEDSVWCGALR